MKQFHRAILVIIGIGMLLAFLRQQIFKAQHREMMVDGHAVQMKPCIGSMNELFGPAVDSVKTCLCIIPKFYELVRRDSGKLKKFKEMGFFLLEGDLNDSASQLLGNCVSANVIDSKYQLDAQYFIPPLMKKLRDSLKTASEFESYDLDGVTECLIWKLSGRLTVKEYFSEGFYQGRFQDIFKQCLEESLPSEDRQI